MTLTERQKRWLNAAVKATTREGPVFQRATLRSWLGMSPEESGEVAASLQREGLVTLLPRDEAILTDKGREAAATLLMTFLILPALFCFYLVGKVIRRRFAGIRGYGVSGGRLLRGC